MNWADSRISRKRASSSGIRGAYSALMSTSGIVCTASHSSCTYPAVQEIRRQRDNTCTDRVVGVAEVVMRVRVSGAERPAGGGEPEAEDGAPDEREAEELAEGDAHDACRDRHERTDERRRQPDRDGPVVEPVEPALGPVELRVRDVDVAAVAVK